MSKTALLLFVLTFAAFNLRPAVAQSPVSPAPTAGSAQPASGEIGPANIWQVPVSFIPEAHLACDNTPVPSPDAPPDFAGCFINQMSKAGASTAAVHFTRMYHQLSNGEVGILTAFKKVGPVDMAKVFYPLRANDNTSLLLVNGDPKTLDVNDMKYLDRKAMEASWTFQVIKDKHPKADIWPTSFAEDAWPGTAALPDGGIGVVIGYPVIDGCHACVHVGLERFRWDFDSRGKFLHTTYMFSPPPPKQGKPKPGMTPAPPAAQPPPQA